MLIESLIRRDGGTNVEMTNTDGSPRIYRFAPQVAGGPHLCEVADKADASTLLSIKEGYRQVKPLKDVSPPKTADATATTEPTTAAPPSPDPSQ